MAKKNIIDVNSLTSEEIQKLEVELGGQVRDICDKACKKANKLLNRYGLSAQMQIVIKAPEVENDLEQSIE